MPVGKVTAKTEVGFDSTLYIGGGNFKIVAINPTKAEKEKLYPGRQFNEEPVYTADREGVKLYYIIIDNYTRTVWLTDDELANHFVPKFSDGTPKIDSKYRVAATGESQLIKWIKNVLNVRDVIEYGKSTYIDKPEDAEIYFGDLKKIIDGDISEIKDMWKLQPDAVFTAMIGVRTTERGSFMSIYTGNMLKAGNAAGSYTEKKLSKIMRNIDDDKARGSLADTEFEEAFMSIR